MSGTGSSSLKRGFCRRTSSCLNFISSGLYVSGQTDTVVTLFTSQYCSARVRFSSLVSCLSYEVLALLQCAARARRLVSGRCIYRGQVRKLGCDVPVRMVRTFRRGRRCVPSSIRSFATERLFSGFSRLFSGYHYRGLGGRILEGGLETLIIGGDGLTFIGTVTLCSVSVRSGSFPLFVLLYALFIVSNSSSVYYRSLSFVCRRNRSI